MKTFVYFFCAFLILFFSSCNNNTKKDSLPEPKVTKEKSIDTIPQKVPSHESETQKEFDLTSKLKEKVQRLAELEHNYQLKSLALALPQKTILFGNINRVQKLKDTLGKTIDSTLFKSELHEVRKAFLKATKPMETGGNTYPRASVEEYIFKTPEAAKTIYDMLMKSKTNGRLWMYVSKSPHDLFLEENRIYFVGSGGFYMMGMYKEIAEKIKD